MSPELFPEKLLCDHGAVVVFTGETEVIKRKKEIRKSQLNPARLKVIRQSALETHLVAREKN